MLCSKPFRRGLQEFGCGQCMPCRINRKRLWKVRLMLELTQHQASSFVTLTYSKEEVPLDGSLRPEDMQLFLKRLRFKVHPNKIRFFGVGEYGERNWRPHYHLALFGVSEAATIDEAWGKGFVHVGTLTEQSADYVVGYITKKMTDKDDVRLQGRYPEFVRMSLKPGIGSGAVDVIAQEVNKKHGVDYVAKECDVPSTIRWGQKKYSIGRYLRSKVRVASGYDSKAPVQLHERLAEKARSELSVFGARERREQKRVQAGKLAVARSKISYSKKDIL